MWHGGDPAVLETITARTWNAVTLARSQKREGAVPQAKALGPSNGEDPDLEAREVTGLLRPGQAAGSAGPPAAAGAAAQAARYTWTRPF